MRRNLAQIVETTHRSEALRTDSKTLAALSVALRVRPVILGALALGLDLATVPQTQASKHCNVCLRTSAHNEFRKREQVDEGAACISTLVWR